MKRTVAANRRGFFGGLGLAAMAILATRRGEAAKTYKYKCPKCNLIQEYGSPGLRKCPNDGWTMVQVH